MKKITIPQWRGIKNGEKVWTGYVDYYITAPQEEGFYTLYEIVSETNTHIDWDWEIIKEDKR